MTFSLTWLPDVLEDAGLKVAEVPGWETRGLGDVGPTFGILCHHTGGTRPGNMPALSLLQRGRPDLRGPLAQLGLGRDGTYYVIAAGKCQHAGKGMWMGSRGGNANFIGIEAMHSGRRDDPWTATQLDAYRHGVAAMLRQLKLGADRVAGHKEYALPLGRKPDPTFDMDRFRLDVANIMNGSTPMLAPIPASEPPSVGAAPKPTLRRGSNDPAVSILRAALGLGAGNAFDAPTEARVRAFQRNHPPLVPDGIVGPKTWAKLRQVHAAHVR